MALVVIVDWLKTSHVLHRARVSTESDAAFLARFFAFRRRLLWRLDWSARHRIFFDAPVETALVEDSGRLRAGHRAGKCFRTARMFLSRMLLGQTDNSALG